MTYSNNSVAKILGTTYPLIQAPMAWVTSAELVAAVSNAGGLGVFGPNAGQREPAENLVQTIERARAEIRKTQALTDKPFGLNLILMGDNQQAPSALNQGLLDMALQEGVRHFALVGNAHQGIFEQIKQHNGVIIFRPLTPTVANMREAEQFGADVLVATGYDEGGILPQQGFGTFTVVPTMVDAVRIPVLAAGDINDRRGANAAFALGAQGIYVGTRFLATQEAPSADSLKQKIVQSGYADLQFVSHTQRSIRTATSDKLAVMFQDPSQHYDMNAEIAKSGGLRPAMLEGRIEDGIICVNTGIDVIKTIPSVAELVRELIG